MYRWLLTAGWALAASIAASMAAEGATVALIELDGPIGPANSSYVQKASTRAVADGDVAIVLRLDTPGGLDGAMRDIIKTIEASPIPVICWVGPAGARAASAGTFILYACHLAAMAPGTNLGAATPIPLGGSWPLPEEPGGEDGEKPVPRDAAQVKAINDAVAYLRSLAEQRNRNADWAELAVRDGASLSSAAALERQVIELVATDIDDLLRQSDDRTVHMANGAMKLHTGNYELHGIEPDSRDKFLAVITNPTVAYLLLLAGIYGLMMEAYHPGAILPGVAGAISLLLATYALQMLPVNYAGLALIALGLGLIVAETFAPGMGLLGFSGVIAFVLGSVLLMGTDVPGYQVNLGVIAGIAFTAAALLVAWVWLYRRARRTRVITGSEALIDATVVALEPIETEGWAEWRGERWRVRSARPLQAGQRARVLGRTGLTLNVEPHERGDP